MTVSGPVHVKKNYRKEIQNQRGRSDHRYKPSGVRLLLDNKKLGYYQSGKRRIIGECHLTEYLTKIERNHTKSKII